jgi:hypothetical protein
LRPSVLNDEQSDQGDDDDPDRVCQRGVPAVDPRSAPPPTRRCHRRVAKQVDRLRILCPPATELGGRDEHSTPGNGRLNHHTTNDNREEQGGGGPTLIIDVS